jgi:hypothetical protein
MNNALRYNAGTDTLVRSWPKVAALDTSSFTGSFSSDRLTAFKSRFSPSSETLGQKVANYTVTAGIYVAIAFAAVGVGTANITPLLHALHLNGV